MRKIAITTSTFGEYDKKPMKILRKHGFELVQNPYRRTLNKKESVRLCKDAAGIIAGVEKLDRGQLTKLSNLRVISRCGAGLDSIDLAAARDLGIKVFNTPSAPTLAVAELTVALILNLLRKINRMDNSIRLGRWEKLMGNLLFGKHVGIIGFGRIGRKVAGLLRSFNCTLSYYDIAAGQKMAAVRRLTLKELLRTSDIVTIHVSAKNGKPIIGKKELSLMKRGAYLINLSRGSLVDEDALYRALKNGRMAGAALDVFGKEPYEGRLRELNNVILTPHIGSYAKECRIEMEMQAVKNLMRGLGIKWAKKTW